MFLLVESVAPPSSYIRLRVPIILTRSYSEFGALLHAKADVFLLLMLPVGRSILPVTIVIR
jgi:hypothetical protein